MFSISVCMIVKNESQVLARVLDCARKFADEIIVVDTGSSDNTVQIARSFTDKVYFFEWKGDFSLARNYSFSLATCDYIMWLDADDYITDSNIEQIIQLKKSDDIADIYMFKYLVGFDENGSSIFEYYRERLLKREKQYKWIGFVHEVVVPEGNIKYLNICIEHRKPYKPTEKERNLKLYQKALKKGYIFSPREQYYYARELYYNQYFNASIKNLNKYLKMKGDKYYPDVLGAYILILDCLYVKKQYKQSVLVVSKFIRNNVPNSELSCMFGRLFLGLKEYEKAVFWYRVATICDRQDLGFVRREFEDKIPYINLTYLYYLLGDLGKAKQYHDLAFLIAPNDKVVLQNHNYFKSIEKQEK